MNNEKYILERMAANIDSILCSYPRVMSERPSEEIAEIIARIRTASAPLKEQLAAIRGDA